MEKDIIVKKIIRDCPICDAEHEIKLVSGIYTSVLFYISSLMLR